MNERELIAQIETCKRRAKNASAIMDVYRHEKPVDVNKVRYWEAEMQKQLGYAKELEDELSELQATAA
jgi:hypothetical protein